MHYNPALDGVRALSILAVVTFHCGAPWSGGGAIGLDAFFVLSGYLITTLLVEEQRNGGIQIGRFYVRRALRLYPTLLLLLVTYLALAPVLWPSDDRWLIAALSGFYLMDYGLAFWDLPTSVGHTWSLGVEEKFYLLWPLLLPLLLRARRPIVWLVAAFVAVTAWRYFVANTWGWKQAYFSFDTRMSGILLGAIAALARLEISRLTVTIASIALVIAYVAPPFMPSLPSRNPVEGVTFAMSVAEISAFALISYVAKHAHSAFLASRPVVYIGKLSYGIYIWHWLPLTVLWKAPHPWWLTLSATLLFSFPMAALCLHFVDAPIKRWRERLSPTSAELPALR